MSFTDYEVKLQKAVTNTHTVDVTCADQWGSSTATLTLVGTVNPPPVISGLPTAVTVNEADAAGTSVYTMTVTDTDSFLCDISSSPTTSNFVIDQINSECLHFVFHLHIIASSYMLPM